MNLGADSGNLQELVLCYAFRPFEQPFSPCLLQKIHSNVAIPDCPAKRNTCRDTSCLRPSTACALMLFSASDVVLNPECTDTSKAESLMFSTVLFQNKISSRIKTPKYVLVIPEASKQLVVLFSGCSVYILHRTSSELRARCHSGASQPRNTLQECVLDLKPADVRKLSEISVQLTNIRSVEMPTNIKSLQIHILDFPSFMDLHESSIILSFRNSMQNEQAHQQWPVCSTAPPFERTPEPLSLWGTWKTASTHNWSKQQNHRKRDNDHKNTKTPWHYASVFHSFPSLLSWINVPRFHALC